MEYSQALRDYLKTLKNESKTDNTKSGYSFDIQSFIKFIEIHYPHTKFGVDLKHHIDMFFQFCRDNGNSIKTINRKRAALKTFIIWAHKQDIIKENPESLIGPPEPTEDTPRVFMNDEELKEFRDVLDKGISDSYYINLRRKTIFALMWHFGATISEVINLKLHDFNLDTGFVRLKGRKERSAPMSNELMQLVQEFILNGNSEDLFTGDRNTFKEFKNILDIMGISSERKTVLTCNSIKYTRIRKCIEDKRDLLSIMKFFGLELSGVKNYIDELDCDLKSVFQNDKLFQ